MTYDLAVIGAGPVGSTAARVAASRGLNIVLLEEHGEAGKPSHCTGKLSARAFREFDLPKECILNGVRGAFFYSPSCVELTVSKDEVESYIIDRELFDCRLAERAYDAGVNLLLNTKVYDVLNPPQKACILKLRNESRHLEVKARVVLDAEGANSLLTRRLGLSAGLSFLEGIQYQMSDVKLNDDDFVELYFGRRLFPGFFGWIVPLRDGKARVGLCVREGLAEYPAQEHLRNSLLKHPVISRKVRGAKINRVFGGRIPIHGPALKTYGRNLLLAGDAAGHTKSTSGGGMYFGLKAAEIAAGVAAECLEAGKTDSKDLRLYENRWKKAFGRELRFTSTIRKLLDEMSDAELDSVFRLMSEDDKLLRKVQVYGDTAYQSRLFTPMLSGLGRLALRRPGDIQLYVRIILRTLLDMAR